MPKVITTKELRAMPFSDLMSEVRQHEQLLIKLRMGVTLQKEKDSAKYRREKKLLARMKTILSEKKSEQLSEGRATTTLAAPRTKPARKASVSSKRS